MPVTLIWHCHHADGMGLIQAAKMSSLATKEWNKELPDVKLRRKRHFNISKLKLHCHGKNLRASLTVK
ncbi:hypothetical protein D623_10019152 [Myotis brandtii]|uniref:Uncharacterized protein n=1 Tax=Myotis brandtii TaxID=109478 RepID=S7N4X2_MYOBR|nr:hypothetical protein D623_10019152 [Myotis brandtii]